MSTHFFLQPNMHFYDGQNYTNAQVAAPAYKYIPGTSGDATITVPAGTQVIGYKDAPQWSWCSTVWSFISMCCFTSVCGIIGLLCSVLSYVDHKSGDYDRSSYKRRCSWGWAVTGIILTLMGVLTIILIFVVFPNELRHILGSLGYHADPLAEPESESN